MAEHESAAQEARDTKAHEAKESKAEESAEHGGKWIQSATEKMKEKGTLGSFGKATEKKIARDKKLGGKMKKKAIFAENMKKIAQRKKG